MPKQGWKGRIRRQSYLNIVAISGNNQLNPPTHTEYLYPDSYQYVMKILQPYLTGFDLVIIVTFQVIASARKYTFSIVRENQVKRLYKFTITT